MATDLNAIVTAVKAASLETAKARRGVDVPAPPFVTIARQAGAGGRDLANHLATRLNELDPGQPPWQSYDRELVDKIAGDHNLSTRLIETLEDVDHPWLVELIKGLSSQEPSEQGLFHRMASTIMALAKAGRAIIVGRGGMFITRQLPGGLHIHLAAPFDWRVQRMAKEWNVSTDDAAKRIREIDDNRQRFYQRHFRDYRLSPENFTLTLNTASIPNQKLVELLVPFVSLPTGYSAQV